MKLESYVVKKLGNSLYEVRRYKAGELLETTTVDLEKGARSDFENKRMNIARRYASENCPKDSTYWFTETGAIQRTSLTNEDPLGEGVTRKHFQAAANAIRAIEDPEKRQQMADFQAGLFSQQNPRFDYGRFHSASGTRYGSKEEG
jgi:hypothetical protein